ncbi:Ca-transporting ATPase [Paxillus ammoniavirescens]|nr:Ca-transporting ATPase [Paxillus ammoniavirescens]
MSLDAPRSLSPSPTFVSSNEGSSFGAPPSPTLSTQSSVQFATSLTLRDNKPDERSGITSLHLLSPTLADRAPHRRKGSVATFTSSHEGHSSLDETEPDHGGSEFHLHTLRRAKSDATSLTVAALSHTHVDSASERSKSQSRSGKFVAGYSDENIPSVSHDAPQLPGGVSTQIPGMKGPDGEQSANIAKPEILQDEAVDPAPFSFKPYELACLLDPKNLDALQAMGGIDTILKGLGTHPTRGLLLGVPNRGGSHPSDGRPGAGDGASQRHDRRSGEPPIQTAHVPLTTTGGGNDGDGKPDPRHASLEDRKRVFGENILPQRPTKSLLGLMWLALKDKVLVLLSIAAVVSLALGLFQDFGTPRPAGEPPVDWVEGVAIVIAILIVVVVGSLNDWQKERQFKVLNEKKEERGVKVIRDGVEHEVVVGDIALLEPGEIVPCDGIFLSGHNVKCDESAATGESDAIKKVPYAGCLALKDAQNGLHSDSAHTDCFVVSGSKVLEGVGCYVVVAVGTKSFNGRIMMALRTDAENTPLQLKLNILAELIAKVGSIAGIILFTALMIRFFVQLGTGDPARSANQNGMAFVQILIISVTLVVVAVPEGLPLAVTLALAFATKRMTEENLLVRVLGSCETMANASVICTDKTGTLTQNAMTIVAGSIGIHAKFVRRLEHNQARTNAAEENRSRKSSESGVPSAHRDFSIDQSKLNTVLSPQLRKLFNAAIAVNSTAFEDVDSATNEVAFIGSKTETALLNFAKELKWTDYKETRDAAEVVQMIPFSSERKAMGVVVKLENGGYRLYVKGASEILTKLCTRHVVVSPDANQVGDESAAVETVEIDTSSQENISRTIIFYANQTLRTIAVCYRDFATWPPPRMPMNDDGEIPYEELARELTLVGIAGIEDPLREGVREAVGDCRKAGVNVKMCTGDNVLTARSIASQCGIFTPGGIIMEGPVFRQLNDKEMLEIVPRLQVLARSSPEDKKILVEKLRALGEIVGVTGDGTNDGPALKTAHVGFSMGIAGTEVAKEASDIILMDDNFSSIVKAIMWGRCVNDAVRKFLQFQLSTNVTAVVVTFVTAVASSSETSVLSAVQLLWINIIMDTFAALALATDPASPALLDRKPDKLSAPLFSVDMYKQIVLQSTYQIVVTLIFHFLGLQILGLEDTSTNTTIVQTVVFNTFVFAQIFNSINSRRLDRKLNIFEGLLRNYYFIVITLIEIVIQVVIVFVGGAAFQVTHIGAREWGISLALGVVSIPLGALIRLLPNKPFERLFTAIRLLPSPEVLPTIKPDAEWNLAIELVRDNLATFANLRGGRLRSSSFVGKSRSARLHDERRVPLPSIMTMVPTLIASSIGAGWAPQSHGSLSDPARYDPSKSSAALWEGKFQIHPDTKPDDPILQKWGGRDTPIRRPWICT